MSTKGLLTRVVAALASAGMDYILSGSLALGLQGEPRATHDIDLVWALRPADVPILAAALAGQSV
jgi:hypothetical protein